MGKTPGGFAQAVWIRARSEWYRHNISIRELVGISGKLVQSDGKAKVLEGQEVWEEWVGQPVKDTDWRRRAKEQSRGQRRA